MEKQAPAQSGYKTLNGLRMYYEVYGHGDPLVLIHGGGSTIQTSFHRIIPYLAQKRMIVAMDMQAHGRTADRKTPVSFKQDADDVLALLQSLSIAKADVLGFSNGGQTAMQLVMDHPDAVNRLIICSAFYNRSAAPPEFWDGFGHATLDYMPQSLRDGFLAVNNDPAALQNMFDRDVERMKKFEGWSDEAIHSIKASTLIINSDQDVGSSEHAVAMHRLIEGSQLVIVPGKHGEYLGSEDYQHGEWSQRYIVDIIENFLEGK